MWVVGIKSIFVTHKQKEHGEQVDSVHRNLSCSMSAGLVLCDQSGAPPPSCLPFKGFLAENPCQLTRAALLGNRVIIILLVNSTYLRTCPHSRHRYTRETYRSSRNLDYRDVGASEHSCGRSRCRCIFSLSERGQWTPFQWQPVRWHSGSLAGIRKVKISRKERRMPKKERSKRDNQTNF